MVTNAPNSFVAGLASCLVAAAVHAAGCPGVDGKTGAAMKLRQQVKTAAGQFQHFATADIIANRPTGRGWSRELIGEQARLMDDLRRWSRHAEDLRELLRDSDSRVRTLALGALFVREDPRELPRIAALLDDAAPTFLDAQMSFNSAALLSPKDAEVIGPQTVGDVARSMVRTYLQAAPVEHECSFAEYWEPRAGRSTCASWFLVRLIRATRNAGETLQPQYREDVEQVLADVEKLEPVERAWTQVFLRCQCFSRIEPELSDAKCVASLKAIGSDHVMQFLERQHVADDPDLGFGTLGPNSGRIYSIMAHFVLRHATELLRAQDADGLLVQESLQREKPQSGLEASPYWAAAAAELVAKQDRVGALRMIDEALKRFPLTDILGGRHQAVLMGGLWRIEGAQQNPKFVGWFYDAQAKATRERQDGSNHGPVDFLHAVQRAGRSDTGELMRAVIADRRFEQTDREAILLMIAIANKNLPQEIVGWREIYAAEGRTVEALARYRELLRRCFVQ